MLQSLTRWNVPSQMSQAKARAGMYPVCVQLARCVDRRFVVAFVGFVVSSRKEEGVFPQREREGGEEGEREGERLQNLRKISARLDLFSRTSPEQCGIRG